MLALRSEHSIKIERRKKDEEKKEVDSFGAFCECFLRGMWGPCCRVDVTGPSADVMANNSD